MVGEGLEKRFEDDMIISLVLFSVSIKFRCSKQLCSHRIHFNWLLPFSSILQQLLFLLKSKYSHFELV